MPSRIKTASTTHKALSNDRDYQRRPDRAEDNRFYCSTAWRKVRSHVLRRQPLCVPCMEMGRTSLGTELHHKLERKDRPDLALDINNLEPCCRPCHNRKRRFA